MSDQPVPSGARGAVDLSGLQSHGDGGALPGAPSPAPGPSAPAAGPGDALHVVATDATFNDAVTRSIRIPAVLVVVSTRLPESIVYLETVLSVARDLGGRLQVVSADVDTNPGLLRALQVQSVPMTLGLIQGQALPIAVGSMTAEQLRPVFDELLTVAVQQGITGRVRVPAAATATADEPAPLPPLHQQAFDAIERGDLVGAAAAYEQALAADPGDLDAKLGLAQVDLMRRTADVDPARARTAAADAPDDIDAQLLVADLDLLGGHVEDAFTRLLDVVRVTAGPEREKARRHLLGLFDVIGGHDDRVRKARTALMSALF